MDRRSSGKRQMLQVITMHIEVGLEWRNEHIPAWRSPLKYRQHEDHQLSPLASVISVLKEDETDQAIEEPDEIMNINRDSESKYDKSDRHETFELNCNFQMLPKELYQEN
ncbi:hypothetical protein TNCV_1324031 [Trichonephila clavipes]|nr:hypothetical protein TNCV_1324031 [Trichonephila clavipes]